MRVVLLQIVSALAEVDARQVFEIHFAPLDRRFRQERARLGVERIFPTGWVYQNKTPNWLAGPRSKFNGRCALAAYTVGAFRKENRR